MTEQTIEQIERQQQTLKQLHIINNITTYDELIEYMRDRSRRNGRPEKEADEILSNLDKFKPMSPESARIHEAIVDKLYKLTHLGFKKSFKVTKLYWHIHIPLRIRIHVR